MKIDSERLQNSLNEILQNTNLLENDSKKQKKWQKKINDVLEGSNLPTDPKIEVEKKYSRPLAFSYRWSRDSKIIPKIFRVAMGKIFSAIFLLKKSFDITINDKHILLSKKEAMSLVKKTYELNTNDHSQHNKLPKPPTNKNLGVSKNIQIEYIKFEMNNKNTIMTINISDDLVIFGEPTDKNYDQHLIEEISKNLETLEKIRIKCEDLGDLKSEIPKLRFYKHVNKKYNVDIEIIVPEAKKPPQRKNFSV